ncbi:hypothetical protein NDA11_003729 [Ustilago hordei]|nr:hypothetical protein NDA11_003729 [Ustilago hordei]
MAQPPPQLPPGWAAQWDQNAGRQVYIETATGRTSWQPPNAANGVPPPQQQQQQQRPTHPQGQARMCSSQPSRRWWPSSCIYRSWCQP